MKITLAKSAGFCFGVKRAVDTVYEQLEMSAAERQPIYTFGPIIHNEEVVRDLEEKGVTNADAVVTDILAAKKAYLAETSKDLKDATTEEVVALLDEADVADDAKAAMARYQLQKLATNGITLNTDGDIKNIESLVSACGGGITALQALANAKKEIFNSVGTSPLMQDFQAKKNGKFNIIKFNI